MIKVIEMALKHDFKIHKRLPIKVAFTRLYENEFLEVGIEILEVTQSTLKGLYNVRILEKDANGIRLIGEHNLVSVREIEKLISYGDQQ